MQPRRPYALGLDLGTSALKAVVVDATGRLLAEGSAEFRTRAELPGQAEQEVTDWLAAARQAASQLAVAGAPGDWRREVRAVGLTGQLPTLVVLGEAGPLGPAITWKDSRADALAVAVVSDRRAELYRLTGMPIDGRYLAPMFCCHWQRRRAEVRQLLGAKDALCRALTGVAVTDPSTAAGYGLYDLARGAFSPELCSLWGVDAQLLPPVLPAHAVAGPLTPAGAQLLGLESGIAVTVGAADSMSGAFAMGSLLRRDRLCIAMGSSTILVQSVSDPRLDPQMRYLLSPHVTPGCYAREMDLLATGTGHAWLSALLGFAPGELERAAAAAPAGAAGVTFAPYLAGGEQGALWNPALRGAIGGLRLDSGRREIARAFLEGVAFEMRRCLEALAETEPITEIVLAGHLARERSGLQLLANILGRPVWPFAHASPAALGAAFGALASQDLAVPSEARHSGIAPAEPEPLVAAEYDQHYTRYLEASGACAS